MLEVFRPALFLYFPRYFSRYPAFPTRFARVILGTRTRGHRSKSTDRSRHPILTGGPYAGSGLPHPYIGSG